MLGDLDAEGSGSVGLVGVALDGDVPVGLEGPVHPAVVFVPLRKVKEIKSRQFLTQEGSKYHCPVIIW